MKKITSSSVLALIYFLALLLHVPTSMALQAYAEDWKAGVARVNITPEKPMWMAGYGGRDHPAEGKLHDLWAKALVMEDANGNQAVLITLDLLGVPKNVSDHIRARLKEKFNLSHAQILINSSHTHSGPVLTNALSDIYPLDEDQRKAVADYTQNFEDKVVALVGEAMDTLEPVKLFAENGVTRFQVNRRNNNEATLSQQNALNGPNDYAVPVIKVVNRVGDLKAIAFGYACHPTVLNGYEWSGDYAGFAQLELEKMYPNTTALFFQGTGADQNPLPRRSVALAKQYGQTLAAAVERVLNEEMRPLAPKLSTAYSEVELALSPPPTKEELSKLANETSGYQKRWANRLQGELERGEPLMTSYPFPLQMWQLGDQLIFSLGGETVIAYAIRLKEIFGQDIFVMGYSNDVMAYIPSARIVKEGGYEGASSQMVYGLPSPWNPDLETRIIHGFVELAADKTPD